MCISLHFFEFNFIKLLSAHVSALAMGLTVPWQELRNGDIVHESPSTSIFWG
jgi:hypothetical protein